MSYAKRVDANQSEIVNALRKVGARVFVNSAAGRGIPDLIVFHRAMVFMVEVKQPGKRRRLTAAQYDFHALAFDAGYTIPVVETAEEAIAAVTQQPRKTENPCSTQPTN